jgi:hypothetical protein
MILSKPKKIFLLSLLLIISFLLSAIKFISGEKTSKAQAACWTAPPVPSATGDSGQGCSGTGGSGTGGAY